MKTTKQHTKGRILSATLAIILTAGLAMSSFANSAEPEKKSKKSDKVLIESLALDFDNTFVLPGQEMVNYKIYDGQDNLVHEATLLKNEVSKDKKLSKLLHKSDLVMKMGSTQYFKIN